MLVVASFFPICEQLLTLSCILAALWCPFKLLAFDGFLRLAGSCSSLPAYVFRQLDDHLGGWCLALLSGQGLLLDHLLLEPLLYDGELPLFQLNTLESLQDRPGSLVRLHHLGRHCYQAPLGVGAGRALSEEGGDLLLSPLAPHLLVLSRCLDALGVG